MKKLTKRTRTAFQGYGGIQTTRFADNRSLNVDLRSERGDIGLMLDSPALAAFANNPPVSDQSRLLFQEWMLGQANAVGPDQLATDALAGVRKRIERNPFEPIFPDVGINGTGISVTRGLLNEYLVLSDRVVSVGVRLPNLLNDQVFGLLQQTLAALPRYSPGHTGNAISIGIGNDIIMPGYLGNSEVTMGDGGDIYLASPQLFAAVLSYNNLKQTTGSGTVNATVLYPTPYALRGTAANQRGNSIFGEGGSDLIYYDSSIGNANGGRGDDTFAPSFGSFNWAIDTLIQGPSNQITYRDSSTKKIENFSRRNNNQDAAEREIDFGMIGASGVGLQTFVHGDAALISPATQFRGLSGSPSPLYQFDLDRTVSSFDGSIRVNRAVLTPNANWGLRSSDSNNGPFIEDRSLMNRLGGQHLIGGEGSDLFYGIDPDWYRTWKMPSGGQRQAFYSNNRSDRPFERPHAQLMQPVTMSGGPGIDSFIFGNPRNLDPWSLEGGDFFYRVSGNHNNLPGVEGTPRRDAESYGENTESDNFVINLTYAGDNWTRVISNGSEAEEGFNGLDALRFAQSLTGMGKDFTGILKDMAPKNISEIKATDGTVLIPGANYDRFNNSVKIASATFSAFNLAFSAIAGFSSFINALQRQAQPSTLPETSSYYRDPVGSWRGTVNIADWDPSDTIAIRVDPSNPASNARNRWENIQFQFNRAVTNTSFSSGSELVVSTENGGSSRPLVRLEEFGGNPGGFAWHAYDFYNENWRIIGSQSSDMAFFGQIPLGSTVSHPGGRDQYNFNVQEGSRVFRWTDRQGLTNSQLSAMQSASENVLLEHDTMAFGYYTDLQLVPLSSSQISSLNQTNLLPNPSVDLDRSKLWIRELPSVNTADTGIPAEWTAYTFRQLADDPKAYAYMLKATPRWSRVSERRATSSTALTLQANEVSELDRIKALVEGFDLLDRLLPGNLPSLKLAADGQVDELTGVRIKNKYLNGSLPMLKDLNSVRGIAIDSSKTSAVVYYDAFSDFPNQAPDQPWSLFKTRIEDGKCYGVYGLTASDIAAEERISGLDLNADGFLA